MTAADKTPPKHEVQFVLSAKGGRLPRKILGNKIVFLDVPPTARLTTFNDGTQRLVCGANEVEVVLDPTAGLLQFAANAFFTIARRYGSDRAKVIELGPGDKLDDWTVQQALKIELLATALHTVVLKTGALVLVRKTPPSTKDQGEDDQEHAREVRGLLPAVLKRGLGG